MKKHTVVGFSIAIVAAIAISFAFVRSPSASPQVAPKISTIDSASPAPPTPQEMIMLSAVAQFETPPASSTTTAPEPTSVAKIRVCTLAAMKKWNEGRRISGAITHVDGDNGIAADIAHVAVDEPKIWQASSGAREAILLASLAWFESLFRDYVDSGDCNAWAAKCMVYPGARGGAASGSSGDPRAALARARKGIATEAKSSEPYCDFDKLRGLVDANGERADFLMSLGTCDGGNAASIFQVQFGPGIALHERPDSAKRWWHMVSGKPGDGEVGITSAAAIADRRQAARVALAMARQSIQNGAGLMGYVGGTGPEREEKARQRLHKAEAWSAAHPCKVD